MTAKLAGFGTTIFAEMSALAVRTGAINLGQGFPDTDGPIEVLDAAVDGDPLGRQSISARARYARAARGHRRTPASFLRPRLRRRHGGTRHRRCHRGARRRVAGDARRRRRGRAVRADVRQLSGLHRARRWRAQARRAATRTGRRRSLRLRSRRVPRRGHRADETDPAQYASQPDRQGVHARRTRVHRGGRCRTRRADHHRRGLRTPRVLRCRARPDGRSARHGRAHAHDLVRAARRSTPRAGRSGGCVGRRR